MVEGFRLSAVWLDSLFIASVPSHALAPGPIRLRYTQSCGTGVAAEKCSLQRRCFARGRHWDQKCRL